MRFTFKELTIFDESGAKSVYYDGGCNLCNYAINFIKKTDKKSRFDFVPLQYSEFRSENTVVYSENGKIYRKSDAVLRILKQMNWTVSWMYIFVLVPRFIRNGIYDFISRNRIRWFGEFKNQVSRTRKQDIR